MYTQTYANAVKNKSTDTLHGMITYAKFPDISGDGICLPVSYLKEGRQLLSGKQITNSYSQLVSGVLKDVPIWEELPFQIETDEFMYVKGKHPDFSGMVASNGSWELFPDKVTYKTYNMRNQPAKLKWKRYFKKKLKEKAINSPVVIKESYTFDWNGIETELVTASNAVICGSEEIRKSNGKSTGQTLPSNKNAAVYIMSAVFRKDGTVIEIFSDILPLSKSKKTLHESDSGISFYKPSAKGTNYQSYVSAIQYNKSGKLEKYKLYFNMYGELLIREYKYFPRYIVSDINGDGKSELVVYHSGSSSLRQQLIVFKLVDDIPVKDFWIVP